MLDKLVDVCKNKDYILKITYHKCRKWNIKIHKNGCNMPMVDIVDEDKDMIFRKVYKEIATTDE